MIVEAYQRADPKPYLADIGQTVRVLKRVTEDGQTPAWWAGAICVVEKRMTSGLLKEHSYKLRHENNRTCDFKESELDRRYLKTISR